MHAIATQLQTLRTQLNAAFIEREDPIEAMLLAVLSKEHVFLLGPPGTGKSLLTRAMTDAFVGASYFETIMSKTRSVDAVMGPLDIMEFRTNGHMWRKSNGFLPTADFAMLDEIGKMSPILGHDMLAALNERVKHEVNGGLSVHAIPLMTCFTASNEMPTNESDDSAALWDRLLIRATVDYIKAGKAFAGLLTGGDPRDAITEKIDFADLKQVIEVEVPQVVIDQDVLKAILSLRKALKDKGIIPSDRRWRQSMKVLKAAAFLDGRTSVEESDLAVLRYTLWDTIPQIEEIAKLTSSASNPFVGPVLKAKSMLQELATGLAERKDKSTSEKADYAKEINPKLDAVATELEALVTSAKGRNIPGFQPVAKMHGDCTVAMYECFGLPSREDAINIARPKLQKLSWFDSIKDEVGA